MIAVILCCYLVGAGMLLALVLVAKKLGHDMRGWPIWFTFIVAWPYALPITIWRVLKDWKR